MLKSLNTVLYLFVILLSLLFLKCRYPYESKEYNVDELYFMLYANTRSEIELKRSFSKQLAKRDNVLQDYMIAYWSRKNNNCLFLDQLENNLEYYQEIENDSIRFSESEIRYLLETSTLNEKLNELKKICK